MNYLHTNKLQSVNPNYKPNKQPQERRRLLILSIGRLTDLQMLSFEKILFEKRERLISCTSAGDFMVIDYETIGGNFIRVTYNPDGSMFSKAFFRKFDFTSFRPHDYLFIKIY